MHTLLAVVFALASLMVSITCWSFLLASRGDGWRAIVHNLGLLALAVGAFTLGAAATMRGVLPSFWAGLAMVGAGVVAAGIYETRFGFRHQLRSLIEHYIEAAARLRLAVDLIRAARSRNTHR